MRRTTSSLITEHPLLRDLVVAATADTIELRNRVTIRVAAASFRGLRGYAIAVLICDELSYWFDGEISANPAEEILNACRPAMLQFRGRAMLLAASSPYRRSGPMWQAFRSHFGKPSPVLVWKASTETMHPDVDTSEIRRAYDEDAEKAAAEYGAEFRRDIAPYADLESLEACVVFGRRVLPVTGTAYVSFIDLSGGSSDSAALAIAFADDGRAIIALIREVRAPHVPEAVVEEFCGILRFYGIDRVQGDAYAGNWPIDATSGHGVTYEVSKRPKSALYVDFLPAINSGRVELLDNPVSINQLAALERKAGRSGKDTVDHPIGGRDDVANAIAGVSLLALERSAPALWSAGTTLPTVSPASADMLVSFVAVDRDGQLLVLHVLGNQLARPKPHCVFADATALPISVLATIPQLQRDIAQRHRIPAFMPSPIYFIDEILLPPAKAAKLNAHHVSDHIPAAMVADHRALSLAAAAYVANGAVAVAPDFVERAQSLPLGSVLSMRMRAEPDPATVAAITAICMIAGDPRKLSRYLPSAA